MQDVDEVYPRGLPIEFVLQGAPSNSMRQVLSVKQDLFLLPSCPSKNTTRVFDHKQGCFCISNAGQAEGQAMHPRASVLCSKAG